MSWRYLPVAGQDYYNADSDDYSTDDSAVLSTNDEDWLETKLSLGIAVLAIYLFIFLIVTFCPGCRGRVGQEVEHVVTSWLNLVAQWPTAQPAARARQLLFLLLQTLSLLLFCLTFFTVRPRRQMDGLKTAQMTDQRAAASANQSATANRQDAVPDPQGFVVVDLQCPSNDDQSIVPIPQGVAVNLQHSATDTHAVDLQHSATDKHTASLQQNVAAEPQYSVVNRNRATPGRKRTAPNPREVAVNVRDPKVNDQFGMLRQQDDISDQQNVYLFCMAIPKLLLIRFYLEDDPIPVVLNISPALMIESSARGKRTKKPIDRLGIAN